jgi:D-alanyl-D-alanine carboxypeptidase
MVGKVGKGEAIFPLSSGTPGKKRYDLGPAAVPISAIGSVRTASPARDDSRVIEPSKRVKPPPVPAEAEGSRPEPLIGEERGTSGTKRGVQVVPTALEEVLGTPLGKPRKTDRSVRGPRVRAKALFCIDCSTNKVVLARNISEPLPIASITKLLTAMTVIDGMKLGRVIKVPADIRKVPRHRVGIRPGDHLSVKDLLHGMLIESGNDCAEALARAYPKGGHSGFVRAMNRKATLIGASKTLVYTPSGLDMSITLGRKNGRKLRTKKPNIATASDVAIIARHAFRYPLIRKISSMKRYTMRTRGGKKRVYALRSNDRLLDRPLPLAGAKTGYTNQAGRCIVALFKDEKKAKSYVVVVLNTRRHFKAAEKIYHWACKTF